MIKLTPIEYPQLSSSFIHYFIEPSLEKGNKWLKEKGYDFELNGAGLTIGERDKDAIIWLRSKRYDVVDHECIHATFHLFKNIGIKNFDNLETQEMFSYFVEYAVKQILK